MTKFYLVGGKVKFLKHLIEYADREEEFYDTESRDNFISTLEKRNIEYTATDYDTPSAELLTKVEGKKFNTMQEAQAFIDGAYKPVEDRLNDIELALLESEGII